MQNPVIDYGSTPCLTWLAAQPTSKNNRIGATSDEILPSALGVFACPTQNAQNHVIIIDTSR